MAESDGKIVKTRRKVSKSCVFCRKRRVKCNKARPKCSTCIGKGLPECVYLSEFTHDVNSRELFSSTPNVELLRRIDELETELARMKSEMVPQLFMQKHVMGTVSPVNRLSQFHLVIEKQGRTIFYGPTSFRAVVASVSPRFYHYFTVILTKLRHVRLSWKKDNNYSAMMELDLIETPFMSEHEQTLLGGLLLRLPSYETTLKILEKGLNSPLSKNFPFLDSSKIMQDFLESFQKGEEDPTTRQSPIVRLIPAGKKNYYGIGVIVMLLCILHYGHSPSKEVEVFLKYLSTSFNGKVFYVERIEFFVLRFIYRSMFGKDGGDCIHTVLFAEEAVSTAIHMGFHKDIKDLYKNHPVYKDRIVYLENLWHLVLFIDIEVSLSLGVPLHVSESYVSQESILDRDTGSLYFLKKVVAKFRSILLAIHSPLCTPDIKALIEDIRQFIRHNYKPLDFYLNHQNLNGQEYVEIESLMFFMSTMYHMGMVNLILNNDSSPANIASIVQYVLFTLKLTTVVIQRYYDLDSVYYPERVANHETQPLWYLQLGIALMSKMSTRSIAEYYTLLFDRAISADGLTKGKYYNNLPVSDVFDLDIHTIEVPTDHYISLSSASMELHNIFGDFLKSLGPKLLSVLNKIYPFTVITSLQNICHVVLQSAFDSNEETVVNTRNSPLVYETVPNFQAMPPRQRLPYQSFTLGTSLQPNYYPHHMPFHPLQQSLQYKFPHAIQRIPPHIRQHFAQRLAQPPVTEILPQGPVHTSQKASYAPNSNIIRSYNPGDGYVNPSLIKDSPSVSTASQGNSSQAQNTPHSSSVCSHVPVSSTFTPCLYPMPNGDLQASRSIADEFWNNIENGLEDWITTTNSSLNQLTNVFKAADSPEES
ncbi:AGL233Cp [Eremothecium gossypii ATCC 10895]|uniref:AGL233Cp n=1 Tax=Eremothecium gossypii (strain ATCC 10895 / CBS 109.51 / FGSC 9923 / NRRL Y-1056) TaxID=284811 RepID=Q751D9_EREGS|nr:AGL233Cp [Eremothecium gossypii ATCC 10895]AAS54258.1 AGL233Cp [Eremothecium gossypii ATCC 10895]AEY98584.1 FAGL233Cp [Eremothecium gossypii FDAG1]